MIPFRTLSPGKVIDKVIIHSLDCSLYQVSIEQNGRETWVMDKNGQPMTARNILELEAKFERFQVNSMVLRHESAYDEMVNQPVRQGSNRMEVPIGRNRLGLR